MYRPRTTVPTVLVVLWACCLVFVAGARAGDGSRRPSVLLIMTDDQSWGDVHSHGNEAIDTPVLDELAAAAVAHLPRPAKTEVAPSSGR